MRRGRTVRALDLDHGIGLDGLEVERLTGERKGNAARWECTRVSVKGDREARPIHPAYGGIGNKS